MPTVVDLPKIEVLMEGGHHISYVNPSDYVCRSFDCPHLPAALLVMWADLPLNKVAAFYESPDCSSRHGYFTFHTDSSRTHVTGAHPLPSGQMIRSMMLGRNEDAVLREALTATTMYVDCDVSKTLVSWTPVLSHIHEATAMGANTTDGIEWLNEVNATGGLSSNWSDELPASADHDAAGEGGVSIATAAGTN